MKKTAVALGTQSHRRHVSYTAVSRYLAAVSQARVMLRRGIISESDFLCFEEKMYQKYKLSKTSIYRESRLIYGCLQR